LAKEGQIQFSLSHAAKPELLNAFFTLEASGWKGANGSAIVRNPKLVNFYTQIAKVAEQSGTLRLYSLDLNGKPVAMHFGLLQNGTYSIPKVAYDEACKKCSPGLLLMKHVLEELTNQGMRCFDFLGPRMEWKCMWTSLFKEHAHCYIFRPTLKGRLLHAASMRLAPKLRELKYRWRGDPQAVEIKAE
jgi:CelD/BcsL family acetyltransferase involved in cellulose biosynthesis